MRVSDVMSAPVRTVGPEDTLQAAARVMWKHACGALPVVDGAGHVVGIVTDRDVCLSAMIQEDSVEMLRVAGAMSPVVHACRADETLRHAEDAMRCYQVRRLPVLDQDDRVVGMLSIDDLAVAGALRQWSGDEG